MLGLILLYFIGKYFYRLAEEYDKNKWGYAILGVVVYYAGTFAAGIIIGITYELWGSTSIDDVNDYALGLLALPFGILSCYLLYAYLKKTWHKKKQLEKVSIDDIGNH